VATIIWAAPRADGCDELLEARKQFAARFGEQFVQMQMANQEMAVNARVFEKLSMSVPPAELCFKKLERLCAEGGVDWSVTAAALQQSDVMSGAGLTPAPEARRLPQQSDASLLPPPPNHPPPDVKAAAPIPHLGGIAADASDYPGAPHQPAVAAAPPGPPVAPVVPVGNAGTDGGQGGEDCDDLDQRLAALKMGGGVPPAPPPVAEQPPAYGYNIGGAPSNPIMNPYAGSAAPSMPLPPDLARSDPVASAKQPAAVPSPQPSAGGQHQDPSGDADDLMARLEALKAPTGTVRAPQPAVASPASPQSHTDMALKLAELKANMGATAADAAPPDDPAPFPPDPALEAGGKQAAPLPPPMPNIVYRSSDPASSADGGGCVAAPTPDFPDPPPPEQPGSQSVTDGSGGFGVSRKEQRPALGALVEAVGIGPTAAIPMSLDGRQGAVKGYADADCVVDFGHPIGEVLCSPAKLKPVETFA